MRIELIPLAKNTISSNPIVLDDYSNRSYAVYFAINNNEKTFYYFKPDEARGPAPRCDYILICNEDFSLRFIELKGADLPSGLDCCRNTWAHAFHQLIATYETYAMLIDFEKDVVKMILCTSSHRFLEGKKRSATRYEQYRYYKKIREYGITLQLLYCDERDEV